MEYFVLFRASGAVRAADATEFSVSCIGYDPEIIRVDDCEFQILKEDDFIFWDDLWNERGQTIGYYFWLPESPTFRASDFINRSENVRVDHDEATILLAPCPNPITEVVQGFCSQVYVNTLDPRDSLLLMYNWSQNEIAFPLHPLTRRVDQVI
ncbi:MAG: hypothetical protein ACHRXM_34220 [Isosphaerales bacterium]